MIDSEELLEIVREIRSELPDEIQQAQWIKQEKDRIINDAKTEYNKVIMSAKEQAEYLVDSDMIKKEAQKRADAVLSQANNEASYMKLRTYEYIDKLLFDMQNDIAGVATSYLQPMNDYLTDMLGNINVKVNQNRQEMKTLAERVQSGGREKEEE